MKHLKKLLIKAIIFVMLSSGTVLFLNQVLTPKYFYNNTWPTTSTYLGFYKMERNTVDVLFFGSSHAASSFSPQILYDRYGITSYNLGCEQQNLITSYYWLKEALRFQKPKAIVLDCYILFPYNKGEALNASESCTRKAMDYMKWSPVKWEAVHAICAVDEKQTLSSYYLPNIRFHTRWTGLNEEDFTFSQMSSHYELKGFTALSKFSENQDYHPFSAEESNDEEPMVELMEEYLDKITELCSQQGISLLLVKTPSVSEDVKKYNRLQRYAEEHELAFIDFNENHIYHKIGYDFAIDNADSGHGNAWGAARITSYLGKLLQNQYGLAEKTDIQWEETKEYYKGVIKDCSLKMITDMDCYLDLIKDHRYWIMIAVKDEGTEALDDNLLQRLRNLGLKAELEGEYRSSYYGIVAEGNVKEALGYEMLKEAGTIRNGRSYYEISSAGYENGNTCSIRIDGTEYAKNMRGINIVVYNHVTKTLVDSVCFDTHTKGAKAQR